MQMTEAVEYQWPYLRAFLPPTDVVEALATRTGALIRRREIASADRLLRLAMVYGFCGFSLRQTAAWAQMANVAHVSDVALLKRFRKSADWMCELVAMFLANRVDPPPSIGTSSMRVRLVDGTTMSKPGSNGVDWRVHLGFDLRNKRIASLELTGVSTGESLRRLTPLAGELLIADRGYARANGLQWVLEHSSHFLVRIPWNTLPLKTTSGEPFDMLAWLRGIGEASPAETVVRLTANATPLRLLALRKSEPAAEASRAKVLKYATNHTKTTDPRTLEAAGYILLLTDLPAEHLGLSAAFDLYRFRWQIELCFKTMKSVLFLNDLSAKDPDLARMVLAAKLLGALLVEAFTERYVSISPWGYPLRVSTSLPLAPR